MIEAGKGVLNGTLFLFFGGFQDLRCFKVGGLSRKKLSHFETLKL